MLTICLFSTLDIPCRLLSSRVFDAVAAERPSADTGEQSILHQLPVVFLSEVHIATVQTILGYTNVPCPLPTRLWGRFSAILELLWERVVTLITSTSAPSKLSSLPLGTLKEAFQTGNDSAWILKLYCPSNFWEGLTKNGSETATITTGRTTTTKPLKDPRELFRLSNPKLIQLVMTWTIRQGAMCPDVESLQRLREFCASRLDVKLGKGIVSKLDVFIKKHGQLV